MAQVSQNFLSESQPVYELGTGGIVINTPDYPGSKNNQFRFIPFPYLVYRGKYLRTDDEGTRARLLSSKYHETGISFGLNFPVKSANNLSRMAMPDLDTLLSIGPRFLFRILQEKSNLRLNFSLATRAVYSTNFKSRFRAEGLSLEPSFNFWYQILDTKTTIFSRIGAEFGSVEYNRFFYEVLPQFSNAARTQYSAQSGLIESTLSLGIGQNLLRDDLFLFASGSFRNLNWSKNRTSPLVETKHNTSFIVGIVWTFYESKQQVIKKPIELL